MKETDKLLPNKPSIFASIVSTIKATGAGVLSGLALSG
jgi:hypothetical protein